MNFASVKVKRLIVSYLISFGEGHNVRPLSIITHFLPPSAIIFCILLNSFMAP